MTTVSPDNRVVAKPNAAETEAIDILRFVTQIMTVVGGPISISNWPMYLYEAVSIVYGLANMDQNDKKLLVVDIIDHIIKGSEHLDETQKQFLIQTIDHSADSVVEALVMANAQVTGWLEEEVETCWKRASACIKRIVGRYKKTDEIESKQQVPTIRRAQSAPQL